MLPNDLRSLPYLVHTNRELGLMLKGAKPLAYFLHLGDDDQTECVVRYLRMFDRHVGVGRFLKEVHCNPVPQMPHRTMHRVFYALPGEAWRIQAMLDLVRWEGEWSDEREWEFGSLLGYEDWQNQAWLDRRHSGTGLAS